MELDKILDKTFEELKERYHLPARLVKGIRTVETTQEGKPLQAFDNPNPERNYHIVIPFQNLLLYVLKLGSLILLLLL